MKLKNLLLTSFGLLFCFKYIIGMYNITDIALTWFLTIFALVVSDITFEWDFFFEEESTSWLDEYDRGTFYT